MVTLFFYVIVPLGGDSLPGGMGAHALPQRRGLRWRTWFPTAPTVFDGAHSFPRRPGQQYLPDSSLPQCRHPLCHGTPGHPLCLGAPASNKPHPAEKSTPVWLAIWRTWAGFANSQLLSAAFRSIYLYIDGPIPLAATLGCCSNRRKSVGPSAPIAYATSVSPPDEAAAWPGTQVLDAR